MSCRGGVWERLVGVAITPSEGSMGVGEVRPLLSAECGWVGGRVGWQGEQNEMMSGQSAFGFVAGGGSDICFL